MADKSKDTGTGGININGDLYTADVVVPNSAEDAAGGKRGTYSPGDVNVDKTVKDISKPTRETFAKYLSKTTLGQAGSSPHKNAYPVGLGDQTTLQETPLKDANGNPTRPGTQNNEAKFSPGLNQGIGSENPADIKRGLAAGLAPDGNTLLPGASTSAPPGGDYIKFVSTVGSIGLQDPIKSYTQIKQLDPNLFDPNTTKVGLTDGTLGQAPANIRNIKIISADSNVGVDGGTSKNILGDDTGEGKYTLTVNEQADLAGPITVGNRFPVDSGPSITRTLRGSDNNPTPVTAEQNNPTNSSYFGQFGMLRSTYTSALVSSNPDFQIKRGKESGGQGQDGHVLLPDAAPSIEGGSYIRFTSLNAPLTTYTRKVLDSNLYSPLDNIENVDDKSIVEAGDFFGPRRLYKPVSGPDDAGTFDNIQSDPSKREVTKPILQDYFFAEINGQHSVPGGLSNSQTPDLGPSLYPGDFSINDSEGYPASPTNAQISEQQVVKQYVAGAQVPSSYSNDATILKIKRGKNASSNVDGNTLLKDAALPSQITLDDSYIKKSGDVSETIATYVSSVLRKNRFNPVDVNGFAVIHYDNFNNL